MRITLRVCVPTRPRNGHVAAMVGMRSGAHVKTNKAKRKAQKVSLRKQVSLPVDPSPYVCGLR